MDIAERIRNCLILEEMRKNPRTAKKEGLKDISMIKSQEDKRPAASIKRF